MIPAIQSSKLGEVFAIASRKIDDARTVANELGIPEAFGSYKELLDCSEVDAVYIPLPNHLHVEWSIKALEAGKHVLCEKPLALNAREAEMLAHSGAGLHVAEAFMYKHHPQWIYTRDLVQKKEIGELRSVHAFFSYYNRDPNNIRNKPSMGGGALMDVGCYGVSVGRHLFGAEPSEVFCHQRLDRTFGTDVMTSAQMIFDGGSTTFSCSTQMDRFQHVDIVGTHGHIRLYDPFNPPPKLGVKIDVNINGELLIKQFPPVDQYALQADHFSSLILNEIPSGSSLSDALSNMRTIDALVQSSKKRTPLLLQY